MSAFERRLVNLPFKGLWNVRRLRKRLSILDLSTARDALEIGCGVGAVSACLAQERGLTVCGADVDPDQIEAARRRHRETERLRFRVEDATRLSFPDASVDLVIAQHVFHHIPEWPVAVAEIGRVLRPGGYLLWLDVVFPRFLKRLLRPVARRSGLYTGEELMGAFRQAGLEVRDRKKLLHGLILNHDLILRKEATP